MASQRLGTCPVVGAESERDGGSLGRRLFRRVGLTHGNKPAAPAALRRGDAPIFEDAESLVQSHRRLLGRQKTKRTL